MDETATIRPDIPPTAARTPPVPEPHDVARALRVLSGDIRPDDYLPIPAAVRNRVALLLAEARARLQGADPTPEIMQQHQEQEVLSYHHGGEPVLYLPTDAGIVVLATGFERVGVLIRAIPPTTDRVLAVCTPDVWA